MRRNAAMFKVGVLACAVAAWPAYGIPAGSANIDRLVEARLREAGITPAEICSDEVFIRRAYLDLIGTLPQPEEVRRFLKSDGTGKRGKLIESLFERTEFADYWSLKWCDLLRVKAEFPSNLWPNAVQAYHRWVWDAMRGNLPYDQFARALLTSSGSNFRVAPVNFYRALARREPPEMAEAASLLFMGIRPDTLSAEQRLGMAAFFGSVGYKQTAEWKEEIVFHDSSKVFLDPDTQKPVQPMLPNGTTVEIAPNQDPRKVFADWLINPQNQWFSKNIVNRIWYWMMGRGIIHEPDDIRPDNPPSNPELLDFLAKELVDSGYDLRHIYRIILNSKTYQRSSIQSDGNAGDNRCFSHYIVRRLDAEVLIDAICQITQTREEYSSAIPEPFTWIPAKQRSIALEDGSITSPFLETFGRPPRDTGYESERNNEPSSAQALHLLNSSHIQQKLINCPLVSSATKPKVDMNELIDRMYLTVLSRPPMNVERTVAMDYIQANGSNPKNAVLDLLWALINTKEFMYRH